MTETPITPDAEYGSILAQIAELRDKDARAPVSISLGPSQRAAIQAYVKDLTGADAGPIVSFQSLPVTDGPDGVSIIWETEHPTDPALVPTPETPPSVANVPVAPAAVEATDGVANEPIAASDAVVEAPPSGG